MKNRIVQLLFFILLVAVAACTPTGGEPVSTDRPDTSTPTTPAEPTTPTEPGQNVTLEDLEGTNWLLVSHGPADSPTPVLPNAPITLSFNNMGELGGQACNHYGGTFTLDGRAIEMGNITQTEMACMDEGIMPQESTYMTALLSADSIYRDGDQLVITYDGSELRFMPQTESTTPGQDVTLEELEGTDWLLVSHGPADSPTAVLPNAPVSLSFDNMGELGGQACNHYGGTFTLDGRTIEMGNISQTLMACIDEGVTQQESAYTAALRSAATIYRDGDQLVITYEGGELRFAPAPTPEPTVLDGSLWRFVFFSNGEAVQSTLTNSLALIGFRNGEIVGYAGCNQFGGPFLTEGETITSVEAASTQRLCLDEAVMAQETALLGGLATATAYTIEGDNLTIQTANGSLGFSKVASPADSLGTEWRLQAFGLGTDAQPLATGTTITLTFAEDGTVSGSAGCNTYSGPYTLNGTALSIEELAQTRMACDEPILTQETNFINALRSARHTAVDGDLLYIVHDDGILVFTSLAR